MSTLMSPLQNTSDPTELQSSNEPSAQDRVLRCLRANDIDRCARWIASAPFGAEPDTVEALCTVVKSYERQPQWVRRRWASTRNAAIRALTYIGATASIPTIAGAMLSDPDPKVSQSAFEALIRFGPAAIPDLHALLHSLAPPRGDWPAHGMVRLLQAVGHTRDRVYTPFLRRILRHPPVSPVTAQWHSRFGTRLASGVVMFLAFVAPYLYSDALLDHPLQFIVDLIAGLTACWISTALLTMGIIGCTTGRRRYVKEEWDYREAAAEALMLIGDKNALPELLEVGLGMRSTPSPAIARALITLLPAIDHEDAIALAAQEGHLLRGLHGTPPLQHAVLDALHKVGTGKAIAPVRSIALHDPDSGVRAHATQVLPILETRRRTELDAFVLVRPSKADPPVHEMLRPALGSNHNDAVELLHPTSPN